MSIQNIYVGRRYIPKLFVNPNDGSANWINTVDFESLTVVLWQGASYTSRQDVPCGIDIENALYWIRSADYNAQVAIYEQNVRDYHKFVIDQIGLIEQNNTDFQNLINSELNNKLNHFIYIEDFPKIGAEADDSPRINRAISSVTKGTIILGSKTYTITQPIILKSYINLIGCGINVTLIQNNGTGNAIEAIGALGTEIYGCSISFLSVNGSINSGHGFKGDFFTNSCFINACSFKNNNDGIHLTNSWTAELRNVNSELNRGYGLYADNTTNNLNVYGGKYGFNNSHGIEVHGKNTNLFGVNVEQNQGEQIRLFGLSPLVSGGYVEGIPNGFVGIRLGDDTNGAQSGIIEGTYLYGNVSGTTLIKIGGSSANCIIHGNSYDFVQGVETIHFDNGAYQCIAYVPEYAYSAINNSSGSGGSKAIKLSEITKSRGGEANVVNGSNIPHGLGYYPKNYTVTANINAPVFCQIIGVDANNLTIGLWDKNGNPITTNTVVSWNVEG